MTPASRSGSKQDASLSIQFGTMASTFLSLFYWSRAGIYLRDSQVSIDNTRLLGPLTLAGAAGSCLYLLVRADGARILAWLGREWLMVMVVSLIGLSTLWSISPLDTMQAFLSVVCVILTSAAIMFSAGFPTFLQAVVLSCCWILMLSDFLAMLGLPFALMGGQHAGLWRGLFSHKNGLGEFAAYAMLVIVLQPAGTLSRLTTLAGLTVSAAALFQARSATATAIVLVGLAASFLHSLVSRLAHRPVSRGILICAFALLTVSTVPIILDAAVDILGRDPTFSGRDRIWDFFIKISLRHPYFGLGYNCLSKLGSDLTLARQLFFPTISTPHNSYIALALGTGWLGTSLFGLWAVRTIFQCFNSPQGNDIQRVRFAILCAYLFDGLFEVSGAFAPTTGFFLLAALSAAVHRHEQDAAEVTSP